MERKKKDKANFVAVEQEKRRYIWVKRGRRTMTSEVSASQEHLHHAGLAQSMCPWSWGCLIGLPGMLSTHVPLCCPISLITPKTVSV